MRRHAPLYGLCLSRPGDGRSSLHLAVFLHVVERYGLMVKNGLQPARLLNFVHTLYGLCHPWYMYADAYVVLCDFIMRSSNRL